jgi:hypothetical protein
VNARRLEKLGVAHFHGINLHDAIDKKKSGAGVPIDLLIKMLANIDVFTMRYLLEHTDEVEKVMAEGGAAAADYEYRFVELTKLMHRRGMAREVVRVGHLFNYVMKDKLPNMEREKSFWGFIKKAYKNHASPEVAASYDAVMENRLKGTEKIKEQIRKATEAVNTPDPDAIAI